MLHRQEMEELSAWIFSPEQANKVEERIRLTLMEDSRINCQTRSKISFSQSMFRCFLETTILTLGAWVLPKNFDFSKGIFREFPEKLQKSGVSRGMHKIFV